MTPSPAAVRATKRKKIRPWGVLFTLIALIALSSIPFVVYFGGGNSSVQSQSERPGGLPPTRATLSVPESFSRAPEADEGDVEEGEADEEDVIEEFLRHTTGSQVTYISLSEDYHAGTATERFARPALSLIKLYLADYVLKNGTTAERFAALDMISSSSDETAEELHRKYPEAIDETAAEYELLSTRSNERWGYSLTSTYDVVTFIAALLEEDPTHPILVAMSKSDEVASDGYEQNFGTAVLPGVIGSKWGWSDDLELHSSVSFGEDFVVAAAVTGSAEDLTSLVENQLKDLPEKN
ncbi:hypothetical protein COCCU_03770 [Corynebacterium occultum]|uniref:Beta-lactamase enzyme family protein n=1 Tax=Corynebacterium occultum TaxID=2675219 RepID=A0A6B8VRG3_9CORY|nr:hypothetical protein [Corynebacterium occultum]QGU06703.1 hypothetical protein COCCU_03770 [Corynebacterium occultum]